MSNQSIICEAIETKGHREPENKLELEYRSDKDFKFAVFQTIDGVLRCEAVTNSLGEALADFDVAVAEYGSYNMIIGR